MEAFLAEGVRRSLDLPLFAGVFYYRSGHERTLQWLKAFLPVPDAELRRDFGERGLGAEEVAAESLRRLRDIGLTRFYLSNIETARALPRLVSIVSRSGMS